MSHMERFMKVYDELQAFLVADAATSFRMDPHRTNYLKEMMNATCLGGKYNRGICVVTVAEAMAEAHHVSAAEKERILHDACVCGWMIEMMQAYFLVEDDIMDQSKTRRGKPCWYLLPGVTTQVAINDGMILFAWITRLATHFLATRPYLHPVIEAIHKVHLTTTMGQFYDVTSMIDSATLDPYVAYRRTTSFAEYTLENYIRIVTYKTSYYTYWLPLMLGLLVSESASEVNAAAVERCAMLMGEYFQAQDDVMDCFTPPEKLGKIGTDIQDAKCSWLAVTFLAHANEEQVKLFKENYGQDEEAKVQVIKRLFRETNLQERFAEYEAGVVSKVNEYIHEMQGQSTAFAQCLDALWAKTYKREK